MNLETLLLPHQNPHLYLTDGGLETTLIFDEGLDLPHFAACDLLRSEAGTEVLIRYYEKYAKLARRNGTGLVLESASWRANASWGAKLGYTPEQLETLNTKSIRLCQDVRERYQNASCPMPISGCIGPRGDGYDPGDRMSVAEAQQFHAQQIKTLQAAGADFVTALTMSYTEEATGLVMAAKTLGMPVVISFTVETDGRLPSGESLSNAIAAIDLATGSHVIYYMVNCAHPSHFSDVLQDRGAWTNRIGGIRANASCKSHAELDEATELDAGNPHELGIHYAELLELLPNANVLGGCCGTGERHVEAIHHACASRFHKLAV